MVPCIIAKLLMKLLTYMDIFLFEFLYAMFIFF